MGLQSTTVLCNIIGRVLSLPNWFESLSCEPLGKRKLRQQKVFSQKEMLSGDEVLRAYPGMTAENLAMLIERQMYCDFHNEEPVFAKPYILLGRSILRESGQLAVRVAPPYTSTPHVSYKACIRHLDFSKVFFVREDIRIYMGKYGYEPLQSTLKKESDRPAWRRTIEESTKLLVELFEGRQAPLLSAPQTKTTLNTKFGCTAWIWRKQRREGTSNK